MDYGEGPGKRIGNESHDIVPESAGIRPLRDQIILEPLEWNPSEVIRVVYSGKPLRGKVKAIGPGCYPWKYYDSSGQLTERRDKRVSRKLSRHFLPTTIKVGEIVELGGLEIGGYLFATFLWGTKEHVICREADVLYERI